jgi:hypothetical protein
MAQRLPTTMPICGESRLGNFCITQHIMDDSESLIELTQTVDGEKENT